MKKADVLIIGSGIAGLQLASKITDDLNVMILTKMDMTTGNSYMAQGGMAAAVSRRDDPYLHYLDTLEAGDHHNNAAAVLQMTKEAPDLVKKLRNAGCVFDEDRKGQLLLGMEGAHSKKRIVHSGGDATGKHLVDFLLSTLGDSVKIEQSVFVFELILNEQKDACIGVKGKHANGEIESYYAKHIILATGGCGQLYSFTSNAESATGDGLALAYIAGAELVDMEFIQFHPTLLYVGGRTRGLISEAVRGEGALLVTGDGERIMDGVHPLKDLAPRHVVSQTMYEYLKRGNQIYLNISSIPDFQSRFPTISQLCILHGIDLNNGMIPVVPGSHFIMGGVKTDLFGRTCIGGLYAIGEVACTGIHGANRLASNSLLEGIFIGSRLAEWLNRMPAEKADGYQVCDLIQTKTFKVSSNLPTITALKTSMMERTGIIRSKEKLIQQKEWLENLDMDSLLDADLGLFEAEEINKVFMYITAWLITVSALERTESRGGHSRMDFPNQDNANWMKKEVIRQRMKTKDGANEYNQTALAT